MGDPVQTRLPGSFRGSGPPRTEGWLEAEDPSSQLARRRRAERDPRPQPPRSTLQRACTAQAPQGLIGPSRCQSPRGGGVTPAGSGAGGRGLTSRARLPRCGCRSGARRSPVGTPSRVWAAGWGPPLAPRPAVGRGWGSRAAVFSHPTGIPEARRAFGEEASGGPWPAPTVSRRTSGVALESRDGGQGVGVRLSWRGPQARDRGTRGGGRERRLGAHPGPPSPRGACGLCRHRVGARCGVADLRRPERVRGLGASFGRGRALGVRVRAAQKALVRRARPPEGRWVRAAAPPAYGRPSAGLPPRTRPLSARRSVGPSARTISGKHFSGSSGRATQTTFLLVGPVWRPLSLRRRAKSPCGNCEGLWLVS